jgi:hypothetical protein
MTRQEANLEILKHIEYFVNKQPELRFWQILRALDIVEYSNCKYQPNTIDTPANVLDKFNTESEVILSSVETSRKNFDTFWSIDEI